MRELPVATELAGVEHAPEARRDSRAALAQGGRVGVHALRPRAHHRDRRARAATSSTTSARATSGTSPPASRTRSRGWTDGCEFLLVFDDGTFSENETFLITDWFAHTPPRDAGEELRRPRVGVRGHPDRRRAHALHLRRRGAGPDRLGRGDVARRARCPSASAHALLGPAADQGAGGQARIVDSSQLPAPQPRSPLRSSRSSRARCASCTGTRTTDEWQYYISGHGAHDRVRARRQGAHLRLPGGRRRLRAVRHGPLRREHRQTSRCASSRCSAATASPMSR